mgnify:CR=1 FL=1
MQAQSNRTYLLSNELPLYCPEREDDHEMVVPQLGPGEDFDFQAPQSNLGETMIEPTVSQEISSLSQRVAERMQVRS